MQVNQKNQHRLPRIPGQSSGTATKTVGQLNGLSAVKDQPAIGSGLFALVVDKNFTINRLLQHRLQIYGFIVASVFDFGDALQILQRQPSPDLIFLDIWLPGLNGLDILEQLRRMEIDAAIIINTASTSLDQAVDALRLGADDYLRKPFSTVELTAVLNRTLIRLQLRRQNALLRAQLDEKHRQLEAELHHAAQIQQGLLPQHVPEVPNYGFAACCLPAREVGGDYYDWHLSSSGVLNFSLVDVMGKGMPAALLMATTRASLRTVAPSKTPADAICDVCAAIGDDLNRLDSFVTLFLGQLNEHRLTYVDAGHGHWFMRRADGSCETFARFNLPLGILPGVAYEESSTVLSQGDALVVYSDGLVDARPDLELTPQQLNTLIADANSAAEIRARLMALVVDHNALTDDLTVLILFRYV